VDAICWVGLILLQSFVVRPDVYRTLPNHWGCVTVAEAKQIVVLNRFSPSDLGLAVHHHGLRDRLRCWEIEPNRRVRVLDIDDVIGVKLESDTLNGWTYTDKGAVDETSTDER